MGCWLGTCAISQLPIFDSEPCRIVFLQQSVGWDAEYHGGGVMDVDHLWTPASMPILGTYDDYGRLQNHDPEAWEAGDFIVWLDEALVEQGPNEHEWEDGSIKKPEAVCLDAIQRHILEQGQRVFTRSFHADIEIPGAPTERHLSYCLVREDVYRAMAHSPVETPFGERGLRERIRAIEGWLADRVKIAAEANDPETERFRDALLGLTGGAWFATDALEWRVREHLWDCIRANADVSDLGREVESAAMFQQVRLHMRELRKFWSPQAGCGMQSPGYRSHKALGTIKAKVIAAQEAAWERDG